MKKYMPLEGLRWSRDSGSTLCDTPQNGRSRTGWGAALCGVAEMIPFEPEAGNADAGTPKILFHWFSSTFCRGRL